MTKGSLFWVASEAGHPRPFSRGKPDERAKTACLRGKRPDTSQNGPECPLAARSKNSFRNELRRSVSYGRDVCVEVDDVAVGVSHPHRTAPPRLRRWRLDDDAAKRVQAVELRVDIVHLDLQRVAANAGLRHRTGGDLLHPRGREEREGCTVCVEGGEGVVAFCLCPQRFSVERPKASDIVGDDADAVDPHALLIAPDRLLCSRRCKDRRYARLHPEAWRAKRRRHQARRRTRIATKAGAD